MDRKRHTETANQHGKRQEHNPDQERQLIRPEEDRPGNSFNHAVAIPSIVGGYKLYPSASDAKLPDCGVNTRISAITSTIDEQTRWR